MSSEDPTTMTTGSPAAAAETLDELQSRHRKEQRDLQSRITQKKKNASKKTRRGVNDECATLEREMRERQAAEESVFLGGGGGGGSDGGSSRVEEEEGEHVDVENSTTLSSPPEATAAPSQSRSQSHSQPDKPPISSSPASPAAADNDSGGAGKKRNRQKERLARRAAEVSAASAAAESEAAGMKDHRALERSYMDAQFRVHGLAEQDIQPDGHCLFSAVADQLRTRGYDTSPSSPFAPSSSSSAMAALAISSKHPEQGEAEQVPQDSNNREEGQQEPGYKTTRRAATEYMASHRDDFEPFLAMDERAGAEGGWDGYIDKMRDTATWGGQLELTALANVYGVEIRVVQDGRTECITPTTTSSSSSSSTEGAGADKRTIWLAYYRHGYGLGEHYNSLRPKS